MDRDLTLLPSLRDLKGGDRVDIEETGMAEASNSWLKKTARPEIHRC